MKWAAVSNNRTQNFNAIKINISGTVHISWIEY